MNFFDSKLLKRKISCYCYVVVMKIKPQLYWMGNWSTYGDQAILPRHRFLSLTMAAVKTIKHLYAHCLYIKQKKTNCCRHNNLEHSFNGMHLFGLWSPSIFIFMFIYLLVFLFLYWQSSLTRTTLRFCLKAAVSIFCGPLYFSQKGWKLFPSATHTLRIKDTYFDSYLPEKNR